MLKETQILSAIMDSYKCTQALYSANDCYFKDLRYYNGSTPTQFAREKCNNPAPTPHCLHLLCVLSVMFVTSFLCILFPVGCFIHRFVSACLHDCLFTWLHDSFSCLFSASHDRRNQSEERTQLCHYPRSWKPTWIASLAISWSGLWYSFPSSVPDLPSPVTELASPVPDYPSTVHDLPNHVHNLPVRPA